MDLQTQERLIINRFSFEAWVSRFLGCASESWGFRGKSF